MLQLPRLEDNMKTISIYQSLRKRSSFEHKSLNNIKYIYQHAGKCDDQRNLKDVLCAAILSTPEEVTYDSPNVPMKSTLVNKPSARKSLFLLTNILNVKNNTAIRLVGAEESKCRATKVGNIPWIN